jgi:hypothetical protein
MNAPSDALHWLRGTSRHARHCPAGVTAFDHRFARRRVPHEPALDAGPIRLFPSVEGQAGSVERPGDHALPMMNPRQSALTRKAPCDGHPAHLRAAISANSPARSRGSPVVATLDGPGRELRAPGDEFPAAADRPKSPVRRASGSPPYSDYRKFAGRVAGNPVVATPDGTRRELRALGDEFPAAGDRPKSPVRRGSSSPPYSDYRKFTDRFAGRALRAGCAPAPPPPRFLPGAPTGTPAVRSASRAGALRSRAGSPGGSE